MSNAWSSHHWDSHDDRSRGGWSECSSVSWRGNWTPGDNNRSGRSWWDGSLWWDCGDGWEGRALPESTAVAALESPAVAAPESSAAPESTAVAVPGPVALVPQPAAVAVPGSCGGYDLAPLGEAPEEPTQQQRSLVVGLAVKAARKEDAISATSCQATAGTASADSPSVPVSTSPPGPPHGPQTGPPLPALATMPNVDVANEKRIRKAMCRELRYGDWKGRYVSVEVLASKLRVRHAGIGSVAQIIVSIAQDDANRREPRFELSADMKQIRATRGELPVQYPSQQEGVGGDIRLAPPPRHHDLPGGPRPQRWQGHLQELRNPC